MTGGARSILVVLLFLFVAGAALVGCSDDDAPGDAGATDGDAASGAPPEPGPDAERLDSGLVMTHVRVGSGPSPTPASRVRVHYHGRLMDGTVFDSSVERDKPAIFPVGRVIPCWTEALQRMKVGGKAEIVCPPGIAYGARGAPPVIPPNATLHFEVELLDVL